MTAVGIAVAVVASVANAFAVVLQAGEARDSPRSRAGRFSLLLGLARRPRWRAGTALLVVAWPLQVLAFAYAPITVVQPTLASGSLVLLSVARLRLGERVGRPEVLGATPIVAGVDDLGCPPPQHPYTRRPARGRAAGRGGTGAVAAYVVGRLRPRRQLAVVIGAGLAMPGSISPASSCPATSRPAAGYWLACGCPPSWLSGRWPSWRRRRHSSGDRRSPWPRWSGRFRTPFPC